ncbi:MAG: hypothetical protein CBC48_07370 [bacterium TMED88]|nr:hypothetical protein [Deltaproteobacteria bacterium]OUV32911.1 MAG: hypothetical protein CBC48_07370 [bacterium TMED88]
MKPSKFFRARSRSLGLALTSSILALCFVWAGGAYAQTLRVGDAAPGFSLSGSDGQTYTLEGILADSKGLVLAWFPKAFTPG